MSLMPRTEASRCGARGGAFPEQRRLRNIGLAALTVLELPHAEQIRVAEGAGYSHVGLRLVPVAGQPFLHAVDAADLERRLADSGIRVLDVEVSRLAPNTDVAASDPVLALAARLSASDILVPGADPDVARLTQRFGQLCDLAGGYGLAANLEPMPWVDAWDVARAMRVIDGAARANGALLVDAIHFFRANNRPADLQPVPKARLRYMQLCDAHPGVPADMQEIMRQARSDRLLPGEGALDLPGLLRALPAALPISLEIPMARPMPPFERARAALERTRNLLAAV